MSRFRSQTVAFEDIETFRHLRNGGQTEEVVIACTRAGETYLFKRYSDEAIEGLKPDVLDRLICWREGLSENDRRILDEKAAWIRHLVTHRDGSVIGVLVPLAGRDFWFRDKTENSNPRDGSCLLAERVDSSFENFPRATRYVVLSKLLESITWFHRRGIAVGDLHPSNFLVSDSLSILLIDTDSFWIGGESAFPLTENDRYKASSSGEDERASLNAVTDYSKFAWITCRAMLANASVLDLGLCRPYMTTEQFEIIEAMLDCKPIISANVNQLIKQWSGCVYQDRHYEYSALLLTRKMVDEKDFRLRPGELPKVKVASSVSSKVSVQRSSGSVATVIRPSTPTTSVSNSSLTSPSHSQRTRRKWLKWVAVLIAIVLCVLAWYDGGYIPELLPLVESISQVFDRFVSWLQTLWT